MFNVLNREMLESGEETVAEVGYMGDKAPLEFELCLRMRQKDIRKVTVEGSEVPFETFRDNCSTFVSIPMCAEKPGVQHVTIGHGMFGTTPPLAE